MAWRSQFFNRKGKLDAPRRSKKSHQPQDRFHSCNSAERTSSRRRHSGVSQGRRSSKRGFHHGDDRGHLVNQGGRDSSSPGSARSCRRGHIRSLRVWQADRCCQAQGVASGTPVYRMCKDEGHSGDLSSFHEQWYHASDPCQARQALGQVRFQGLP